MNQENWKEVPGFNGKYIVSDWGKVFNRERNAFLRPTNSGRGYRRVALYNGQGKHMVYVHLLVAELFIPDYRPGCRIRFLDGDPANCMLDNLLFGRPRRAPSPTRIRPRKSVMIVETGEVFNTVREVADHIGGYPSNVYQTLKGRYNSYLGYTFDYIFDLDDE